MKPARPFSAHKRSKPIREVAARVTFGRRQRPPELEVPYRRVRLSILCEELNLLFCAGGESDRPGIVFAVGEGEEPSLSFGTEGTRLSIEIDPQTGLYVLHDEGERACSLVTASEERLIDHMVERIAWGPAGLTPRTADAAISMLVGRSLEDVERHFILRTLAHFKGDLRQAALALGIDESALRIRVRRYLMTLSREPERQQ